MRVSGVVLCCTNTNVSTPNCVRLGGCCALWKSSDSFSRRAVISMSSSSWNVNILSVDLVSDSKSKSI